MEAVSRLVGVQAQQPRPPFIALWSRVSDFRREELARAIHARQIVRVTAMRATLHLMTAADYLALRPALQPALTAAMRSALRDAAAGMDLEALLEAASVAFADSPRTFTSLRTALLEAFPNQPERAMGYAVRTHLPLISVPKETAWAFGADTDFALAHLWLSSPLAAEIRTEELVLRYLAAYGPATVADAQAFTALPGLQAVFERLRPRLMVFRDERKRELFDLQDGTRPSEDTTAPVRFLADFDNAILAHADRSRIIADEFRPRILTKNLLVAATFLVDGFVAGSWKCARDKTSARVELTPFVKLNASVKKQLAEEGRKLGQFLEPDASKVMVQFV